tara:strand:+ start:630 stop:1148 length:519 start_codon:yes stop_codon:yes gene_type:complete
MTEARSPKMKKFSGNLLGYWKHRNKETPYNTFKSTYAITKLTSWPPGEYSSIMFIDRARTAIRDKQRVILDYKKVALVGTTASLNECAEWLEQQELFQCFDLTTEDIKIDYLKDIVQKSVSIPKDSAELYRLIEVEGRTIGDLSRMYNCSYANVYNRLINYKKKLKRQGILA